MHRRTLLRLFGSVAVAGVPGVQPPASRGRDVEDAVDVARERPAHREDIEIRADGSLLLRLENPLQGKAVARRHDRKGDVHDVHADVAEQRCQLHLLFGRKGHPRHLLPVAQRVVVQGDTCGIRETEMRSVGLRLMNQRFERFAELNHADTVP